MNAAGQQPDTADVKSVDDLTNTGFVVRNPAKAGEAARTVVVVGPARGGTSMAALVLEKLGVYMGETQDRAVLEDVTVARALEEGGDLAAFDRLVRQRDSVHRIWGWKRPGALRYVDRFAGRVRGLCFIVMFRDPLAIALRNTIALNMDLDRALRDAQAEVGGVVDYALATLHPALLVSYEKAMVDREGFVDAVAAFLGLAPDPARRDAAIAAIDGKRHEYIVNARPLHPRGRVDDLHGTVLAGWARGDADDPVEVEVYVDGALVATVTADRHRPDLEKRRVGTGHHGFRVDLADHLRGGGQQVNVRVRQSGLELRNSPLVTDSGPS